MSLKLSDWLNSINSNKNDLSENISEYSPFIINKCMSGYIDTLMQSNEMNRYHFLDKDIQYQYYLYGVRKKKRFSPWIKSIRSDRISIIKEYYNYSDRKAKIVSKILSDSNIESIKKILYKGGSTTIHKELSSSF